MARLSRKTPWMFFQGPTCLPGLCGPRGGPWDHFLSFFEGFWGPGPAWARALVSLCGINRSLLMPIVPLRYYATLRYATLRCACEDFPAKTFRQRLSGKDFPAKTSGSAHGPIVFPFFPFFFPCFCPLAVFLPTGPSRTTRRAMLCRSVPLVHQMAGKSHVSSSFG